MPSLLQLDHVVSALIGGGVALGGQAVTRRFQDARTARRLSMAFWEELNAVHFYGPEDDPNFAGFSSQTFDTLFREVADTLPESLARDLMRYHWRMKYMEDFKKVKGGGVNAQFWREAQQLHDRLIHRLEHHRKRSLLGLFCRSEETSSEEWRKDDLLTGSAA